MTFPVLTLTGDAHARGVQHGRTFASRVTHSIASYARLFAYYRGLDWAEMQRRALVFLPVLEAAAPELVTEMRGIAEGSDFGFEEILALNARTELLAGSSFATQHPGFGEATARNIAAGVPHHKHENVGEASGAGLTECTTFTALPEATTDGRTWLAQNWDWSGDQRAACVLLRVHAPGKPALVTMTEAGMVGKIGVNDAGIGVGLNILASELDGRGPGLPVHVLLRLLMETRSMDEALALVRASTASGSSCVTIADARGDVVCLEITPGGVGELRPVNGVMAHSNHCLSSTTRPIACAISAKSSTLPRFSRADALLAEARGAIDEAALIRMLRDRDGDKLAICRYPDNALHPVERVESVCGIVIDVVNRVMHVAADVPERVPFVAYHAGQV